MKSSTCKFILLAWLCVGASFLNHAGTAETNLPLKKRILFICTGNYYRSRFAEALFNKKAADAHLEWSAISRGFKLERSQRGISSFSLRELVKRGVPREWCKGDPKALTAEDLEKSDFIVLMDEAEHRPMLKKQFPAHDDRKIHYWHIGETWEMSPAKACAVMGANIDELLRTFKP